MHQLIMISISPSADTSRIHRLRNFGEELFRIFRDGRHAFIDIADVDRATDRVAVLVKHKRQFRRILRAVEDQIERDFSEGIASISIEVAK